MLTLEKVLNEVSLFCPLKFETENRIYKIQKDACYSMSWILQNIQDREYPYPSTYLGFGLLDLATLQIFSL